MYFILTRVKGAIHATAVVLGGVSIAGATFLIVARVASHAACLSCDSGAHCSLTGCMIDLPGDVAFSALVGVATSIVIAIMLRRRVGR